MAGPDLLGLGSARRLVQQHVGDSVQVIACWHRPVSLYDSGHDDQHAFYFAIVERVPRRIGATRHVAVDRRTGTIREIGWLGE